MAGVLDKEIEYFNSHRGELVEKYLGRFALVKDDSLIGVFNTIEDAIREGARQFGLSSFLVREVTVAPLEQLEIPALKLGILNANSTHPV